ncbi:hypothetical protein C8R42DRAFT_637378 [Lentinula raphanica]|nr:hypothetical protein C8R42DRAFT_637378 [Lentinula raphanica]
MRKGVDEEKYEIFGGIGGGEEFRVEVSKSKTGLYNDRTMLSVNAFALILELKHGFILSTLVLHTQTFVDTKILHLESSSSPSSSMFIIALLMVAGFEEGQNDIVQGVFVIVETAFEPFEQIGLMEYKGWKGITTRIDIIRGPPPLTSPPPPPSSPSTSKLERHRFLNASPSPPGTSSTSSPGSAPPLPPPPPSTGSGRDMDSRARTKPEDKNLIEALGTLSL